MFHEDCLECCFIAYPRDMEVVTALFALNGLGLFKKTELMCQVTHYLCVLQAVPVF